MHIPDVNPEQKRMFYVRALQQRLIHALFADADKKLENAMWAIAQENQTLLRCNTPTFVYDGRWYPVSPPPNPTESNRHLHPDLHGKVHAILSRVDPNDQDIRAGIESLISNVLSAAKHRSDLQRLLPDSVITLLPVIDPDIFDVEDPLPEHRIMQIRKANQGNMKFFKRMLMTQLLLAKT